MPVNGEPIIISTVKRMVEMGITEIGIVVNESQGENIQETVGNGEKMGASITYILQKRALGLADAVRSGYAFIQSEPFLLMLGDNIIAGPLEKLVQSVVLGEASASLLLAPVDNPSMFGIASIEDNKIVELAEKPQKPNSNLAIVGAYAFNKDIWSMIDGLVPSARGEYELTDAIQLLLRQGKRIAYSITTDPFFDIGTYDGWLKANRYLMGHAPRSDSNAIEQGTDVQVIPPVFCHPTAKVYQSVIGPYVYIGPGSIVNHCKIENSILMENTRLSNINAIDSLFGANVNCSDLTIPDKPSQFILGDKSLVHTSITSHVNAQDAVPADMGLGEAKSGADS
jgi:glucose-1-phosphate thymidylyltransferase